MPQNEQVLIDSLPQGKLEARHYRFENNPAPEPGADEVLVRTTAFAITAGTRAGLQGSASYAGAPAAGIVMNATGVGEVVSSNVAGISGGSHVMAPTGWQQLSVHKARDVTMIPADHDPLHYLGALGVIGLTAYFGLW
jgi:NADPH-dependent curcumin reductase CurA